MESLSLVICACRFAIALFCARIRLFHCSADWPPEGILGDAAVIFPSLSRGPASASGFFGRFSFVIIFGFAGDDASLAVCFFRFSLATSPSDWPYTTALISSATGKIFRAIWYIDRLPRRIVLPPTISIPMLGSARHDL